MNYKWIIVIVVLLAVLGGGGWYWKKRQSRGPEGEVTAVKRSEIKVSVQEVASIEPLRKVEIKSKVAGQIGGVFVDIGDKVKAGTLLMRLDPADSARDVKQVEARARITESQLAVAKSQLEFKTKAHASGALSDLELNVSQGEVKRLEAQIQVDQVELQAARDRLAYTELRSPIDGIVLARNVQPGEMVTPGISSTVNGLPLLVVAQIETLLVRTELNQIDVARIKMGDKVDISVDALPGKKFIGKIYRVAAMAQKSERRPGSNLMVFPVDVSVDRSQPGADALKPGMLADITIALETKANALVVPIEALVREGAEAKLFKVMGEGMDDESVVVTIGLQNDREVEILSGAEEGTKIRINPPAAGNERNKRMKL